MAEKRSKEDCLEYINILRAFIKQNNFDALFINSLDELFNPYSLDEDAIYNLTGFYSSGDATVVLTQNDVVLFTDKRYVPSVYDNSISDILKIELCNNQENATDKMFKYCFVTLPLKLKKKVKVTGSDKNVLYSSFAKFFNPEFSIYSPLTDANESILRNTSNNKNTTIKRSTDVENCVFENGERIFEKREVKIKNIYDFLSVNDNNVDALFLQNGAEISYILNLRDYDVSNYSKKIDGVFVLQEDRAFLFTDYIIPEKTLEEFKNGILLFNDKFIKIFVFKSKDITKILPSLLPHQSRIAVSNGFISLSNVGLFSSHKLMGFDWINQTPFHFMAQKCSSEIKGFEKSCINDALSYIKLIYSFTKDDEILIGDEKDLSNEYIALKEKNNDYLGESFSPIVAFASHSKSPHYNTEKSNNTKIDTKGVVVFDAGSQYIYGTTDCTRTFVVNTKSDEIDKKIIDDYTTVLKSQIKVITGLYKKDKVTGLTLDQVSRSVLWNKKLDYNHSLGHSVDTCLCVHGKFPSLSSVASPSSLYHLKENMVFSIEPGFYDRKNYGIRIENLVKTVLLDDEYLALENLTLIPYEKKLINKALLTQDEIDYINNYHKKIYSSISVLIEDKNVKKYLKEMTSSI